MYVYVFVIQYKEEYSLQQIAYHIDIIKTIGKQIGEDGLSYPKEFANQIADMAHSNVRMADIEVPVIIISGTKDLVSQPDKIVDKKEVDDIVRRRTEGAFVGEKLSSRGEVLKNSLFKKSPYVVTCPGL